MDRFDRHVRFIAAACLAAGICLGAPAIRAQGEMNEALASSLAGEPITVYTAKRILTMERGAPEATAIAVQGKRILAVGTLAEVKSALGAQAFTVNATFASRVILPGFIEQHLHPVLAALTLTTEVISIEDWDLPGKSFKAALTPKEYVARLKAVNAAMKDKKAWLFSWGYQPLWHGKLDRKALDAISTTRPIIIWHRSCHEFYLNTAAIDALGLTEEPMRDHGDASAMMNWKEGHWWETGVNLILPALAPVFATPERMRAGLQQMIAYLHLNGVTAFNEPGALITPAIWEQYQELLGAASTPFYSYFIVDARSQVDEGLTPEQSLAATEKQVALAPQGKVSFFPKQIKLFADGAIVSQLMQMNGGYLDGHQGEWLMTPKNLEERARLYWNAGYQLHIHVNGDLGLDIVLDILERLMAANPRTDHRTVIVHFANSTEEQVARIAKLGAIVSANPYYPVEFADKYAEFGLGPQRANAMVRSASVLKNHVPLSFHSDLPIAPADPLFLAWCAVNRITPSGRVAGSEQRIGVEDALRAVTIEAAYSWRKEKELGSLAPGKIANFTILEQDPLAVDPTRLKDIPIWGTVFEGRLFPIPKNQRKPMVSASSSVPPPAPPAKKKKH
jgi:predicted amidohydrolase YtcJ